MGTAVYVDATRFFNYIFLESVLHVKCRAVLGLALAPVVEACRGDIGVPEPFLDLCDIGLVRQRIRCRRRPQRMHAQPVDLDIDARFPSVFRDDVVLN